MSGFVKIARKMLEWEWYTDVNVKILFFHILLKANWKDGRFRGLAVPRGSLVTSISTLSDELGITIKQVRTALAKLEKTGEVGKQTASKFTIISITNYSLYQNEGKQGASKGQDEGKMRATIEERKKERKEEKNINTPRAKEKPLKLAYGEFKNVMLTDDEFSKLVDKHGKPFVFSLVEEMSAGIEAKGYKYKSHYAAFRTWAERRQKEQSSTPRGQPRATTVAQQLVLERESAAKELLRELGEEDDDGQNEDAELFEGFEFGFSTGTAHESRNRHARAGLVE